jgi:hypothetical protein
MLSVLPNTVSPSICCDFLFFARRFRGLRGRRFGLFFFVVFFAVLAAFGRPPALRFFAFAAFARFLALRLSGSAAAGFDRRFDGLLRGFLRNFAAMAGTPC